MDTVIQILILLASISLLIWGATKFIDGSIVISNALGVPKIVIGMTIVSLGTSAPEILVSINAALNDSTQLAVGNAIGSNIANVGLVLGVTACISKVPINASLIEKEIPILAIVSFLAGLCLYDNILGLGESTILFLTFIPITLYLVSKYKFDTGKSVKKELGNLSFEHSEIKSSFLWFFIGLVALLIGSEFTVKSAQSIAMMFGISELLIGATILALGTSLPELAASITSAVKKNHDIAIGNIIGSNIFNIVLVMSIAGIISPTQLPNNVFDRDFLCMAILTAYLIGIIMHKLKFKDTTQGRAIGKLEGMLFLAMYLFYYVVIFF